MVPTLIKLKIECSNYGRQISLVILQLAQIVGYDDRVWKLPRVYQVLSIVAID